MTAAWDAASRELLLRCDAGGVVRALDGRARRKLRVGEGESLLRLSPPGAESKLVALLARGIAEAVRDSEIPLVCDGRVETFSFSAFPDEDGGVALLGSSFPEDFSRVLSQVQETMDEVVALNREIQRQRRDLEEKHRELGAAYRALDESSRGMRSLHAELAEKAEVLQRTADVRARVVANVSHEFRTPVHTILGLSRLLLDGADGPLNDEQLTQVRFIRASGEELSHLVNDVLDLARAESGKTILRPEKVAVEHLLAALRGALKPLVPAGGAIELVVEPAPGELVLENDGGKVSQILRNLVTNALKFTERGVVRVSASAAGDHAVFRVTDTGIGISPDDFERIFEEFGQVDSELQRRVKGTGLGLPLSRRLASVLGGSLEVESEPGAGSTFTLSVPRVHPEVREMTALQERPIDPARAPVLVVEDDRRTVFVYEKFLSSAGFQAIPARTTDEARRLVRSVRPIAVVLDIALEGESSWQLLSELKHDPETADIPVLVVTITNKEQKARALGADEFWLKPVDQDRLLRRLAMLARPGAVPRVLVIDDDERARYRLRKHLDRSPYQLVEAGTGAEGVRIAREQKPAVILLDFLLGEGTAFDVLDELKADPLTRAIPVVVVTSQALAPEQRERLSERTEAVLSKESLSREIALNRIRDALRKARARGGAGA